MYTIADAWGWTWERELKNKPPQRWSQEWEVELAVKLMLKACFCLSSCNVNKNSCDYKSSLLHMWLAWDLVDI